LGSINNGEKKNGPEGRETRGPSSKASGRTKSDFGERWGKTWPNTNVKPGWQRGGTEKGKGKKGTYSTEKIDLKRKWTCTTFKSGRPWLLRLQTQKIRETD